MKVTWLTYPLFRVVTLACVALPFVSAASPIITNGVLTEAATAITGTSGDDQIVVSQSTNLTSSLTLSTNIDIPVLASATGVDGLAGNDTITNAATLRAASATDMSISLTGTESTGRAASTGVAGGIGSDLIINSGTLVSTSSVKTVVTELILLPIEVGFSGASAESRAGAVGIDGGSDGDQIINTGTLRVDANASMILYKSRFSLVGLPVDVFATGDADTRSFASATGISVGTNSALDQVLNSGNLLVSVVSTSLMSQVNMEMFGASRISGMTVSTGIVAGITGNAGNNRLTNSGTINAGATAGSLFSTGEIKKKGLFLKSILDLFADVGTFNVTAYTEGVGMDGGAGDDILRNEGPDATITVTGSAYSRSDQMTLAISLPAPSLSSSVMASRIEAADAAETNYTRVDPYADAKAVAWSTVTGISGGTGNDQILNTSYVSSTARARAESAGLGADISLSESSMFPFPGAAITDTSLGANATAFGLDGGAGNDTIENSGLVQALAVAEGSANTTNIAVNGTMEGFAMGVTVGKAAAQTDASATGISGGAGTDVITNLGTVASSAVSRNGSAALGVTVTGSKVGMSFGVGITDAKSEASATAFGIDTGADTNDMAGDVVMNAGNIGVRAGATNTTTGVSVGISATLQGVAGGVAAAITDGTGDATATGIRTGNGDDLVMSATNGVIDAGATAQSSSTSVSVTVSGAWQGAALGASLSKSTTEANSASTGIETGAGNDTVLNESTITNNALARAESDVVAVTVSAAWQGAAFGISMADGRTVATADAFGINTGAGSDTNINRGAIATRADANSDAQSSAITVSVAVKGVSAGLAMARAGAEATSRGTGIDLGTGDDLLLQQSSVNVQSDARARVGTITLNFSMLGAALSDASTTADAKAIGLDGGTGSDWIQNEGRLTATANGAVDANGVTVNLIGYASGDTSMTNRVEAIGIYGGDVAAGQTNGETLLNLTTNGIITVMAHAQNGSGMHVAQLGGAVFADVKSIATAQATGMAGGTLDDVIGNEGTIGVTAISTNNASSAIYQLAGVSGGSAGLAARSTVVGLAGGNGSNVLWNADTGNVTVEARASTLALNVTGDLLGANVSITDSGARASATGIGGGTGTDLIENEGVIEARAHADTTVGTAAMTLFSFSAGSGTTEATIAGINAGSGNDSIENWGTINVGRTRSTDTALASSETIGAELDIFSLSSVSARSSATLTGIEAGAGDDTIRNSGNINAGFVDEATAYAYAYGLCGQAFGAGATFVGATVTATNIGINGGSGVNRIYNEAGGAVAVHAFSSATASSKTDYGMGVAFPTLSEASATATTVATGIQGGSSDDLVSNAGAVYAHAKSFANGGASAGMDVDVDTWIDAESTASATSLARGVDLGGGVNDVVNSGTIISYAEARAVATATAGASFDSAGTEASSRPAAVSLGITGGDGVNHVLNEQDAMIFAVAFSQARNQFFGIEFGGARADSQDGRDSVSYLGQSGNPVTALARAISLGNGDNVITNHGTIDADANFDGVSMANSSVWYRFPTANAQLHVQSTAEAIVVGNGNNLIYNDGLIITIAWAGSNAYAHSFTRDYSPTATSTAAVTAYGYGIRAGDGGNTIINDGQISVLAHSRGDATSYADENVGGFRTENSIASVSASSTAYGIVTGNGDDTIVNTGSIDVKAWSYCSVSPKRRTMTMRRPIGPPLPAPWPSARGTAMTR